MSHFDDLDVLFIGDNPKGCLGGIFIILLIVAVVWAFYADSASQKLCTEHGDKYIDSRAGYTLCEQDGGTVVRR